jgi:cation transport ATPase
MMNRLILMLGLLVSSSGLLATEQVYQADVEGMVCAFCAYSVSRNVAGLPGVDADSVDVDLENGEVTFSSSAPRP